MEILSKKFGIIAILTFIILFGMNYVGSEAPDRLSRALLIGIAGVVGLAIGMKFIYPKKEDDSHPDFD